MGSLLGLLTSKLEGLGLRFWAFGQLWWVDRHLHAWAVQALQDPLPSQYPELTPQQWRAIQRRVRVLYLVAPFHPVRPQCLHRSLVLYRWLVTQGVAARLEVGWGQQIGHAWVSYGSWILNDQSDVRETTPPLRAV
ncbi:lasso peptide biosynthesis B2 protein [Candidatus Cyanaurora vandensis]|uniref:lasso peptide biosynthesis B2 protein n=1 Tax=Candidatus Cyanaurora vandensis TaxID=2714958 RepID=UPI0025807F76|nr:lasso peptide biosynthesis B2 protein [Candidatus Cyanaurora vandensis]